MRQTRRVLGSMLLLGGLGLGLVPSGARALSEIPFYVTNEDSIKNCVLVYGPWMRTSGQVLVDPNVSNFLFYSAEINIFSPYGSWTINYFEPGSSGGCDEGLGEFRGDFATCTLGEGTQSVSISCCQNAFRITGASCNLPSAASATAAAATADPVTFVAAAFLGHNELAARTGSPAGGKPPRGSDHFRFEGRAGDTVELVLDRDGARGSTGEVARLSLRGGGGGVLGKRQGAVPLRLEATLPAAGRYEIEVAEVPSGPGGKPFRGHYRLRVTSGSGLAILLEPQRSVEP